MVVRYKPQEKRRTTKMTYVRIMGGKTRHDTVMNTELRVELDLQLALLQGKITFH